MPDRPGLDDSDALKALLDVWRDGQADIDSRLARVHDGIKAALGGGDGIRVGRLRKQVDRLEELRLVTEQVVDDLATQTTRFITEGSFAQIYAAGANVTAGAVGLPFSFTAPHRAAIEVLSRDLYDDVLTATRFVDDASKDWVRQVSRKITGLKLTSGTPVRAQARRFEREISREFNRRGMASVIYRDGSRHGFGEYAEMLLRTKTGTVYNVGTLNQGRLAGITHYEILDGSLCGLISHHDPELANGLIVRAEVAASYPLSHPNCRRALNPRPDVNAANAPDAPSVQSPEARADQTAFEEALRQQAATASQRRSRRLGRGGRPGRAGRARGGPERAPVSLEEQARRVEALNTREENIAKARALADRARADRARTAGTGKVDPALLRRFDVTEDQWLAARRLTPDIQADIRAAAKAEADELGKWLQDNDLYAISRPQKLRRQRDIVSGRERFVREQSGYDWLEQLDGPAERRVRARMVDNDLYPPDLLADQVRRKTNLDLSDDEAMDWLIDRWLHEDGLRSIASGRIPSYANPNNLIPSNYSMEGYDLERLFGEVRGTARRRRRPGDPPLSKAEQARRRASDAADLADRKAAAFDDAVGHVAQVQAEAAERFARSALPEPRFGARAWEMDAGDFVRELEQVEDILRTTVAQPGIDPGDLFRWAQGRIRELAPTEIDLDGSMNPYELFESILSAARTAGRAIPGDRSQQEVLERVAAARARRAAAEEARTVAAAPARDLSTFTAHEGRTGVADTQREIARAFGDIPANTPVRVRRGPGSVVSLEEPLGQGVAMVDDAGRLFFVETDSEDFADVIKHLRELAEWTAESIPTGRDGLPVHIVTRQPVVAAQATASPTRIVHYGGRALRETTWHENGHGLISQGTREIAERFEPKLNGLTVREVEQDRWQALVEGLGDDTGKAAVQRRAHDLGLIDSPDDLVWFGDDNVVSTLRDSVVAEVEEEFRAAGAVLSETDLAKFSRFYDGGPSSKPGPAWVDAMQKDADHLAGLGDTVSTWTELNARDHMKLRFSGRGTWNGLEGPGVTDYGAAFRDGTEDVAEAWRLFTRSKLADGRLVDTPSGPLGFADVFPNRARWFKEYAEAFEIEI